MPVVGQGDRRQRHAVGGVGVAPHRLAQHVHHPVGGLAPGHQGVQRPGGDPHDVAPGLVVLGIPVGSPAGAQEGAHQPLAEIVAGVVILPGEVLLADVVEDVVDTRDHLLPGQGEGEAGIQNGEAGHHRLVRKDVADLLPGLLVGDHRAGVHL